MSQFEREPAKDGSDPFDYDAKPSRFYFDVEAVGQLPPEVIVEKVSPVTPGQGMARALAIAVTVLWCLLN